LSNELRVLAGVAEEFDTISRLKKYKRTVVTTNELIGANRKEFAAYGFFILLIISGLIFFFKVG
jgi:hypothetical protein